MYTKIYSKNDIFLLFPSEFREAVISFFGRNNPVKIEEFEEECGAVFNVESDYNPSNDSSPKDFSPKLSIITDIKKWIKAAKKYKFTNSHLPEDRYYPAKGNGHKDFLIVFKSLPKRDNQKIKEVRNLFEKVENAWFGRMPCIQFIYLNKYNECRPFKKMKKHVIMSKTELERRLNITSIWQFDIITSKNIKLIKNWGLSYIEKVYVGKHKIGYKFEITSENKLMLHMLTS